MTELVPKGVNVSLPALLVVVFSAGLILGITVGIAAFSYGFDRAQDIARIERAAAPKLALGDLCPPARPPGQ